VVVVVLGHERGADGPDAPAAVVAVAPPGHVVEVVLAPDAPPEGPPL
jgi:hypothetical protein